MTTYIDPIADYAHALRYEDLSADAIRHVKRCLIDTFGVALGAFDEEPCQIARALAQGDDWPAKSVRVVCPFTPGGSQIAIAPARNAKSAYEPVKAFIHVMHLADLPLVLIINPALPVAN